MKGEDDGHWVALPSKHHPDDNYYFNVLTGVSRWEKPRHFDEPPADGIVLQCTARPTTPERTESEKSGYIIESLSPDSSPKKCKNVKRGTSQNCEKKGSEENRKGRITIYWNRSNAIKANSPKDTIKRREVTFDLQEEKINNMDRKRKNYVCPLGFKQTRDFMKGEVGESTNKINKRVPQADVHNLPILPQNKSPYERKSIQTLPEGQNFGLNQQESAQGKHLAGPSRCERPVDNYKKSVSYRNAKCSNSKESNSLMSLNMKSSTSLTPVYGSASVRLENFKKKLAEERRRRERIPLISHSGGEWQTSLIKQRNSSSFANRDFQVRPYLPFTTDSRTKSFSISEAHSLDQLKSFPGNLPGGVQYLREHTQISTPPYGNLFSRTEKANSLSKTTCPDYVAGYPKQLLPTETYREPVLKIDYFHCSTNVFSATELPAYCVKSKESDQSSRQPLSQAPIYGKPGLKEYPPICGTNMFLASWTPASVSDTSHSEPLKGQMQSMPRETHEKFKPDKSKFLFSTPGKSLLANVQPSSMSKTPATEKLRQYQQLLLQTQEQRKQNSVCDRYTDHLGKYSQPLPASQLSFKRNVRDNFSPYSKHTIPGRTQTASEISQKKLPKDKDFNSGSISSIYSSSLNSYDTKRVIPYAKHTIPVRTQTASEISPKKLAKDKEFSSGNVSSNYFLNSFDTDLAEDDTPLKRGKWDSQSLHDYSHKSTCDQITRSKMDSYQCDVDSSHSSITVNSQSMLPKRCKMQSLQEMNELSTSSINGRFTESEHCSTQPDYKKSIWSPIKYDSYASGVVPKVENAAKRMSRDFGLNHQASSTGKLGAALSRFEQPKEYCKKSVRYGSETIQTAHNVAKGSHLKLEQNCGPSQNEVRRTKSECNTAVNDSSSTVLNFIPSTNVATRGVPKVEKGCERSEDKRYRGTKNDIINSLTEHSLTSSVKADYPGTSSSMRKNEDFRIKVSPRKEYKGKSQESKGGITKANRRVQKQLRTAVPKLRNMPSSYLKKEIASSSQCVEKNISGDHSLLHEDDEEMDWEPIEPEKVVSHVEEFRKGGSVQNSVNSELMRLCNADVPMLSQWFIVLDTNVLLSHLDFVSDLLVVEDRELGTPTLYVPWVVLQELDGLKSTYKNTALRMYAIKAVRFLYDNLASRHPRLRGQPMSEYKRDISQLADDDILQCSLNLQKSSDKVLLLTNDRNLFNKAIVSGVECCSAARLYEELENRSLLLQSEMSEHATENSTSKKDKGKINSIICMVNECVKKVLEEVLRTEMILAYDRSWSAIVAKKPPWSLNDVLFCLLKHWIAVFSMVWQKQAKEMLENIQTILKKTQRDFSDLEILLETYVSLLNSLLSPSYRPYIDKALSTLKELQHRTAELKDPSAATNSFSASNTSNAGDNYNVKRAVNDTAAVLGSSRHSSSDSNMLMKDKEIVKSSSTSSGLQGGNNGDGGDDDDDCISLTASSFSEDIFSNRSPDAIIKKSQELVHIYLNKIWEKVTVFCGLLCEMMGMEPCVQYQRPEPVPSVEVLHQNMLFFVKCVSSLLRCMERVLAIPTDELFENHPVILQFLTVIRECRPFWDEPEETLLSRHIVDYCIQNDTRQQLEYGKKQFEEFENVLNQAVKFFMAQNNFMQSSPLF